MEGVTYVSEFFRKMETLNLRAKFETLTYIFKSKLIFSVNLH